MLGLVVNAIVLWNTVHMDRAIAKLGNPSVGDNSRLSPLAHSKINMLGRFAFEVDEAIRLEKLQIPKKSPRSKTTVTS